MLSEWEDACLEDFEACKNLRNSIDKETKRRSLPDHIGHIDKSAYFTGKEEFKREFIQRYLGENSDMADWDSSVIYSLNKSKRWTLQNNIAQVFTSHLESLQEEEYSVTALGLMDPNYLNSKQRQTNRNRRLDVLFQSKGVEPIIVKKTKTNTLIPKLQNKDDYCDKCINLVYQATDPNPVRTQMNKSCCSGGHKDDRRKKFSLSKKEAWEGEQEARLRDEDEDELRAHVFPGPDQPRHPVNVGGIPLGDFIVNFSSPRGKQAARKKWRHRTGNAVTEAEDKQTVSTDESHNSFKGSCYYVPFEEKASVDFSPDDCFEII